MEGTFSLLLTSDNIAQNELEMIKSAIYDALQCKVPGPAMSKIGEVSDRDCTDNEATWTTVSDASDLDEPRVQTDSSDNSSELSSSDESGFATKSRSEATDNSDNSSESSSDESGFATKSRSETDESGSVKSDDFSTKSWKETETSDGTGSESGSDKSDFAKEETKSPKKEVASESNPSLYRCLGCDKEKEKSELKTCSRCRVVQYCSVPCQRKDYPRHREECLESIWKQGRKSRLLKILDDALAEADAKAAKPAKLPVQPKEAAVKAAEPAKPVKPADGGKSARTAKPAKAAAGPKSSNRKKEPTPPESTQSGCPDPNCRECFNMTKEEAERKRKFDAALGNRGPMLDALVARRHTFRSEVEFGLAVMKLIPKKAQKYFRM